MSVTVVVSRGHRSGVGTLCLTSDQDLRWENVQRTETGNDSEETQTITQNQTTVFKRRLLLQLQL